MSTNSKKIVRLQDQLQKERRLVSFDSYDVTIKQLLDMYEAGHIFVPPPSTSVSLFGARSVSRN